MVLWAGGVRAVNIIPGVGYIVTGEKMSLLLGNYHRVEFRFVVLVPRIGNSHSTWQLIPCTHAFCQFSTSLWLYSYLIVITFYDNDGYAQNDVSRSVVPSIVLFRS